MLPISERFTDMASDLKEFIGRELEGFDRHITRDAVRAFAASIGETHPMFHDVEHAQRLGMKDLPVPPTFLITLELDHRDSLRFIRELGLDPEMVLHGEQTFTFQAPVHAGDDIIVERRITGAGVKASFSYLLTSNVFRRDGQTVATSECTWLIANREETS